VNPSPTGGNRVGHWELKIELGFENMDGVWAPLLWEYVSNLSVSFTDSS